MKSPASLWCLLLLWWGGTALAASPVILVLGDSLSSAYGMNSESGWVSLLQRKLREEGFAHRVVNASISGDTTQGALSRLPSALARHAPDIVIVEIGGNDGLRATAIEVITDNLSRILKTIREQGAKIVLTTIQIPPNYGPAYSNAFREIYPPLASRFDTRLVPFFMQGVATESRYMQEDGIHPNSAGQPLLLANVWVRAAAAAFELEIGELAQYSDGGIAIDL